MMKKILLTIILMLIFIPNYTASNGTTKYNYIDVTVNADGSMTVREYFSLEGSYNGSYRDLNYIGSVNQFKGDKESLKGSAIYNGSSISDIKVYDTIVEDGNIILNNEFINNQSALIGDYGVYQLFNNDNGVTVKIFKPSSYNSAFYIEYKVNDVVVIHNDVAEIAWKFFGENYLENTENLRITFNLPNTNKKLRAWLHDEVLTGKIELKNNHTVEATYDYLSSNNYTAIRLVFDKEVVPYATKYSNINALDKILEIEQEWADQANARRRMAKRIITAINVFIFLWYVGLVILVVKIYKKYDKEHKTNFNHKYYREFPNSYSPEIVEYLFKKKVTPLSISASILELIRKKHLKVEMINDKDYKLIRNNDSKEELTESERHLIKWFIDEIGDGNAVTTKDIRNASNNYDKANEMLSSYELWREKIYDIAENEKFFEDNINIKIFPIIYSVLGAIIILFLNIFYADNIFGYSTIPFAIISGIYFANFTKRTIYGNERYHEWNAFKRFLMDFGRFKDKELPEVYLWEKYLVYATVLGIATKLSKIMQIKLENMNISSSMRSNYTFLYLNNIMMGHTLTTSITSSINNTITNAVAHSNASSGSGLGGGSSFGGGGFGGGGGGGRF